MSFHPEPSIMIHPYADIMLKRIVRKKCRCEVMTVPSAEEAWLLLEKWQPDIVLTDIKMPGMNGLTLLQKIKGQYPAITVIMMSGFGTVESAIAALKTGVYDFILKPFDNEHLLHTLQRCLDHLCLLKKPSSPESTGGTGRFPWFHRGLFEDQRSIRADR